MTGELYINGIDGATIGVAMGDGFLAAIDLPAPTKDFIENSSRLEHGKRVVTENIMIDERDVSLTFVIRGNTLSDYRSNLKSFTDELYKGLVDISLPSIADEVYHFIYKSSTSINRAMQSCSLVVKFNEPNPTNRL